LGNDISIFTDREEPFEPSMDVVKLPDDKVDGTEFMGDAFEPPRALHYAPVNLRKVARRNEIILQTILERDLKFLIIDVSVEIAMLARVSSIPYIYRRQPGDRKDLPHLNAYEGAAFLVAYYPPELENETTPKWVVEKTVYLGFISKHSVRGNAAFEPLNLPRNGKKNLFHITGFGGAGNIVFDDLKDEFNIYGIGRHNGEGVDTYDKHFGKVPSTRPFIDSADILFASCGANGTSEILSLGKRFVAIPETRPFDEQRHTAKALHSLGWAVDYSRYNSPVEAKESFMKLDSETLPDFDIEKFKSFCSELKSYDFELDRFCDHSPLLKRNTELSTEQ